jgi:hypothetical protein
MTSCFHGSWTSAAVAALLVALSLPAGAREWDVEGKLRGEPKKENPNEFHKAKDVSGIACTSETGFPRKCLVIDDEVQWAQVVIVHENKIVAGETIPLIDNAYKGEPLELDGEGVAYADGYFYVMGSHGSPRRNKSDDAKREAQIAANSQLVRIRLSDDDITPEGHLKTKTKPEIKTTDKLRKALAKQIDLKSFAEQPLDENGLTVEGVAIRGSTLYAGLRAPALAKGRAVVVAVPVEDLFDGKAGSLPLTLHRLTIGKGNGIRDLVVYSGEFLVLTGPAPELKKDDPGHYAIYRWTGAGDVSSKGAEVPVYPKKDDDKSKYPKPEAILPLEQTSDGLRILVIYEGAEEGRPRDLAIGWK